MSKALPPVDLRASLSGRRIRRRHCTLLMAGRRPDLWTAVSAWCPISDLAAWHKECLPRACKAYSEHIEQACGGDPAKSETARREARLRSPLTWMKNAAGLPVDINTGIHDGHTGSVPVSQSIHAYNLLAAPADRISDADIAFIVKNERIPEHLKTDAADPSYGAHPVLFRRQSNIPVRFRSEHDMVPRGLDWPEPQFRRRRIGPRKRRITAPVEIAH